MEYFLEHYLDDFYAFICLGLVYLGWRASPDRAFLAALFVFFHWFAANFYDSFDMFDGWRLLIFELTFAAFLLWASIHWKYELFAFLALILAFRGLWDAAYDFMEFDGLIFKWGCGVLFCVEIGRVAQVSIREIRAKRTSRDYEDGWQAR